MKSEIYKSNIRINYFPLLLIALIIIISVLILHLTTQKSLLPNSDYMLSAAKKMNLVYQEINKHHLEINLPINEVYDPNQTGFIGEEFSLITTTLGNLDAKQIALNPDFTALMIKWILQLNISGGDTIVIHASASFPALTIMAIIACEELNIIPVILTSVGASSWGANVPELTYLDIENHLYKNKIIKHRSIFVTPGGNNDNGLSFWDGGMEIIKKSSLHNNYILKIPASLDSAIIQKWNLINGLNPVLFINIGGNHAAMGKGNCAMHIPVGLITKPLQYSDDGLKGLIYKCSDANIPVMHFLRIKEIAYSNGIDLFSFSTLGQSDIYYQKKVSLPLVIVSFLVIVLMLFVLRNKIIYKTPSSSNTISTNRK